MKKKQTVFKIQKVRLKVKFKTSKIVPQKKLHRKKSSHLDEILVQSSKNPQELWKLLKSFGLNAKEGNKAKISLNKDGTIQFKHRENANIFKKFYSNKFNSGTIKNNCTGISNNK